MSGCRAQSLGFAACQLCTGHRRITSGQVRVKPASFPAARSPVALLLSHLTQHRPTSRHSAPAIPHCVLLPLDCYCRYGCAYTGADATFYEPSKELMKKMAYYYDIPTSPWAFIFDVDLKVGGKAQLCMSVCRLVLDTVHIIDVSGVKRHARAWRQCITRQ